MEWLISRTLMDESGNQVVVAIGGPSQIKPDEWDCPYEVSGLSEKQAGRAPGVDALQALLVALDAVYRILQESSNTLTWSFGEHGDTGIPRLPPMAWGLALRHHVETS